MRFHLTTNALDRLQEAEGLLTELRLARNEPNTFRHKANQFVAAVRSVPAMVKTDYGLRRGFDAWWAATDPQSLPELAGIKTIRDISQHERVLTHADYGGFDDAITVFDGQLQFMKKFVAAAMRRFEGRG
jgi:hypothetical protein